MVKLRNAYYCNLKLLLILLVIYGHGSSRRYGKTPPCIRSTV